VTNWDNEIMTAVATALLESLWQGATLAGAAWLVLMLLERRSAALRHIIGMAFLLAIAIAPMMTFARSLAAPAPAGPTVALDMVSAVPPMLLAWIWCAGVAWKLVTLASGWRAFRRLEARSFVPLPTEWLGRVERLRRRFAIDRPVEVRLVTNVLACSARLLRPVIWLPATLLTRLAPDHIEAILAHELAHIRRLDWLWNGLQCAVETLLFYHPGVWWLSARIRHERENACDDLAVQVCGDPILVAEALGALETMRPPAFVLSSQGGSLMKRVSRLLTPMGKPPARWMFALAAVALVGTGTALALQSGSASTDAAPRWWQLHGDATQLSATVGNEQRQYVRWHDGSGQSHERYVVNGKSMPIDTAARRWIADARIAPLAPIAALPPIPAPPPPPAMTDAPAYQAAVAALRSDPAVRAALGTPTTIRLAGPSRITSDTAKLTLAVQSAKGTLRLQAIRETRDGGWRFETIPAGEDR
jgi:beta-lactamase regulating signal transducer with metallopeptidase domain